MKIDEKLLGKRILYRLYYSTTIIEGVVEEISPNGEYVKIDGRWYCVSDIKVLDVLESKSKLVSPNEKYKI